MTILDRKAILDGRTGFDFIDRLSKEDRIKRIEEARSSWQAKTIEERTKAWEIYYNTIRTKKSEYNGRLRNVSDLDVLKEYYNQDLPAKLQKMEKDLEQEANAIVDPQEQMEYRAYAKDLMDQLLSIIFFKYG